MGFDLRLPNIKGATEREQLAELKSYMHYLVGQLQFALNTINTSGASTTVVSQTPRNYAPSQSSNSLDAEVAFDALKPLIIKSADIVQAYYEEIVTRLEGVYVAESDFGTFSEQTTQSISQNSTDIEQCFTDLQQILTDIENVSFTLAEVNAHIRSGLLYYDENEIPVYGLEIGQKNTVDGVEVFNKFARFTADRLSFYDQNDREVAYVSDYKLYIRNVEITSSYKIGGFVDTVMANGDVVTKWVGGYA
jgi:hypothetical protein